MKPFEKLAKKWVALADRLKADWDQTMSDGLRIESHEDAAKRYRAEQLSYCAAELREVLKKQENLSLPMLEESSEIASESSSKLLGLKQMYATSGYVMPDDIAWLLDRAERSVMPDEEQKALLKARLEDIREEYEKKYAQLRSLSSLTSQVDARHKNHEDRVDKTKAAVERVRGAIINRRKRPDLYDWETFEKDIWNIVEGALRKPGKGSL
jgi:hypothetical protein